MEDYIVVVVEQDIDQGTVNFVINQLRLYILANLISGEIVT